MKSDALNLESLRGHWDAAWPRALEIWSRFTKLSPPRWCLSAEQAGREGLSDSFAMIRLHDQAVVVNLKDVEDSGIADFPVEVLAHEIGHHIYVPASLLDHGRLLARIRRGLPDRELAAPLVANLYADLLINDRLQRQEGLDIAGVYRAITQRQQLEQQQPEQSPLWKLYLRTYEILWSLERGTLATLPLPEMMEADAGLAARVIRSFAREWLDGAGRFAVLCLTWLLKDKQFDPKQYCRILGRWCDTICAGNGAAEIPAGLIDIDDSEARGIIHPMFDPELSGIEPDGEPADVIGRLDAASPHGGSRGQCREPFEYGAILRALGLKLSDHDIAVKYYRERAVPWLVNFPVRRRPRAVEPLPEGLELWDLGQSLEQVDWLQTVLTSPAVIPGVTTQQRVWGTTEGGDPERRPIDLDLYVDCSGSMPNPQRTLSPVALAGAIIVLSALRVGSAVQATLWSGARQFVTTGGFVRNAEQVLRVLTGYIGGGTAFPIHILRDTYTSRRPTNRAVHLLIISDDGVTTMFNRDERKNSGRDISQMALQQAGAGGTMVLNLWQDWHEIQDLRIAHEQGWDISVVRTLDDLIPFARDFSRRHYEREHSHAT